MTPRDIYNAPVISARSNNLYSIRVFLNGIDLSSNHDAFDAQTRVVIKTHFDPYIDGDRGASLYSVWFDSWPVMICKTGGRSDYEYSDKYVTDNNLYFEMLAYLKTLEKVEDPRDEDNDVYGIDEDIKGLSEVYCYRITLKDLGPVAHSRQWFTKFIIDWANIRAWPYSGLSEYPDYPSKNPTLEDKKKVRWQRILQEIVALREDDPESQPILDLLTTCDKENGDRELAISQTSEILLKLMGEDGSSE